MTWQRASGQPAVVRLCVVDVVVGVVDVVVVLVDVVGVSGGGET